MHIEGHHDCKLILDFVRPWTLAGGPGVHLNGKYCYSEVAMQETLVCFIDAGNFKKVLASNSNFSGQFITQG